MAIAARLLSSTFPIRFDVVVELYSIVRIHVDEIDTIGGLESGA
jgi:hypothetical protein